MRAWRHLSGMILASLALSVNGATWTSPATGQVLPLQLLEPSRASSAHTAVPVVFYLKNLATLRVGTETDDTILKDLRATGHLVVLLDYAQHPRARSPELEKDFVTLRRQLQVKTILTERSVDLAHVFIIPAGHRLQRDVVFYRDAERTLAMDIIYPSQPATTVGAVLEFSCDNANRMGNYSLDYCSDTLLPSAAIAGHAVAMADHPVAAPYQGLDSMPDCARKIKAAVRTLRAEGTALGLNGRIVSAGFSRGSGMALLLATTHGSTEFEDGGEHRGIASDVQGAIVMSGRFTYLDLLPDDKMIPRYTAAWGPRDTHEAVWRQHGALDYLTQPTVPLFLTINVTESPDALHQMKVLQRKLTELGSPFESQIETEPRGHRMPLDPAVLVPLHRYLQGQLQVTDNFASPQTNRL